MSYDLSSVPEHIREGLNLWLTKGVRPGGFLCAVLKNDLEAAVLRADDTSLLFLRQIVMFLVDQAPAGSFGSPKVLSDWPQYLQALERQAEQAAAEG